jgi:hypothetical protein
VLVTSVSGNYFQLLDLRPALGRLILASTFSSSVPSSSGSSHERSRTLVL